MFERYTEKARRVIFFARYEASMLGSGEITTEHLLLGLFREDKRLLKQLVPGINAEAARRRVEEHAPSGQRVPTSVDMPLSPPAKRLLMRAAKEAERLGHKHIGTEHLLLGLSREKDCLAATIPREHGFDVGRMRDEIRRMTPPKTSEQGFACIISQEQAKGWGSVFQWEKRRCEPQMPSRTARTNGFLSTTAGPTTPPGPSWSKAVGRTTVALFAGGTCMAPEIRSAARPARTGRTGSAVRVTRRSPRPRLATGSEMPARGPALPAMPYNGRARKWRNWQTRQT